MHRRVLAGVFLCGHRGIVTNFLHRYNNSERKRKNIFRAAGRRTYAWVIEWRYHLSTWRTRTCGRERRFARSRRRTRELITRNSTKFLFIFSLSACSFFFCFFFLRQFTPSEAYVHVFNRRLKPLALGVECKMRQVAIGFFPRRIRCLSGHLSADNQ